MGGTMVSGILKGEDFLTEIRKEQEQAEYMYGHDGYNGTVSTISYWQDMTHRLSAYKLTPRQFANMCRTGHTPKYLRGRFNKLEDYINKREGMYVKFAKKGFAYRGMAAC